MQAEAAAAPPFFVPRSAADSLQSIISSATKNLYGAPQLLNTGIAQLDGEDGVLGGGIPTGTIIGISSDTSTGLSRTLALKMLCRHLMKVGNRHQRAMIVDSTGTFNVQMLVEIAKGCTTREYTHAGHRMVWRERHEVLGVLERVGITRVFDIEGVWDVIGEIRGEITEGEEQDRENGLGMANGHPEQSEQRNDEQREFEMEHSSMRDGGDQENDDDTMSDHDWWVPLQAADEPPLSAPSLNNRAMDAEDIRSDDTQPFGPLAGPPSIPDSPPNPGRPPSSPLTPPLLSNPVVVDTSSPLSSPPKSPSSSSSLRSELIIDPSPIRPKTNTVLAQAYQGEAVPSTFEEEEDMSAQSPSPPQATVSPSPLPPSSPHVAATPAAVYALPSEGFEEALAADSRTQATQPHSSSDSDSSSCTSSYVSSPSPERNQFPPGSQWDEASKTQEPPSILLIDSLLPLLTELFGSSSDRTTAHRQLQQLSRILTSLSRSTSQPLTVIVLNSTTTLSPAKSIEEGIVRSAFADVNCVPSFGAVYEGMVDLNLLVSRLPARQGDAENFYGGQGGVRWTNVVECLRDDCPDLGRYIGDEDGKDGKEKLSQKMNREGRWGAFDVVTEGEELMLKDPELGRKLRVYEVVHFGRRP